MQKISVKQQIVCFLTTVFIVAGPRVPDVTDVTLIIRIDDREPTRTFSTPFDEEDGE